MDISFIIPAYNEEESVKEFHSRLTDQMNQLSYEYELIFVDDGSTDKTYDKMLEAAAKDSHVTIIKLRKNFGKSVALDEGINFSRGEIIFTMDADLQDDPKEIPRFISKLNDGFDLVSGWKKTRKDPLWTKNIPSKIFNFMIGLVSGLTIHDYNCGFKAYKKNLAKRIPLYGDLYRYIPAIAHSMGFKVAEIPVEHHQRKYGISKYGINRFTHGLFDFITIIFLTRYLKRPMHLFGLAGIILFLTGTFICLYLTIIWCFGAAIGHRPLLTLGVLLILLGTQFIFTGLIAEMIAYGRQKKVADNSIEKIINGKYSE